MDIHQLKQRIDASGKKLVTLGNEYIKSKDEIAARKVLVKMNDWVFLCRKCLTDVKSRFEDTYQYGGTWKSKKK